MQNDDSYYEKFPWKQTLIEQPLEGAAVYFGNGRIIFRKQVPGQFKDELCHLYCKLAMDLHHYKKKKKHKFLSKHMYFHR